MKPTLECAPCGGGAPCAGAHCSEGSYSSPAQQGALSCDSLRTPVGGPQPDPSMALAPFFYDAGRPGSQRLKEKRKQRQLARSPYARRPSVGSGTRPSAGVRRKLLEEEQQRLLGLPRGEYSRHRLSLVGKALQILGASELDSAAEDELGRLLSQLSLAKIAEKKPHDI